MNNINNIINSINNNINKKTKNQIIPIMLIPIIIGIMFYAIKIIPIYQNIEKVNKSIEN